MSKIDICKKIQTNVSKLSENEILELFKIIEDNNTSYTKNNNGIFLNLNWVDEEVLTKMDEYISFCIKSQNEITKYELMKNLLNESIKAKDKIVDDNVSIIDTNEPCIQSTNKQKFSSSMKFYLLKKRYFKQNMPTNNIVNNEITYEEYVIT